MAKNVRVGSLAGSAKTLEKIDGSIDNNDYTHLRTYMYTCTHAHTHTHILMLLLSFVDTRFLDLEDQLCSKRST